MRRLILLPLCFLMGMTIMAGAGQVVAWSPFGVPCDTARGSDKSAVCRNQTQDTNPISGTSGIILKVANLLAVVAGVAAVIAIIVSGIRFITASGDPNSVNAAKNTIMFATIGLIVVLLARSIVAFILNRI